MRRCLLVSISSKATTRHTVHVWSITLQNHDPLAGLLNSNDGYHDDNDCSNESDSDNGKYHNHDLDYEDNNI